MDSNFHVHLKKKKKRKKQLTAGYMANAQIPYTGSKIK